MDKIKRLLKLQETLNLISQKMSGIASDIETITACVRQKKLIAAEVSNRVIVGLQDINGLNDSFKNLYDEVSTEKALPEKIEETENIIAQAVSELELEAKLSRYKKFLALATDDNETRILLEEYKKILEDILDNYAAGREDELVPYEKFVEAVLEKDEAKCVGYMIELSETFSNKLLGKAFMKKTVYVPGDAKGHAAREKVAADVNHEPDSLVHIEEIKETAMEGAVVEETVIEQQLDMAETDEIKKAVIERKLLVTKDVCDRDFFAEISKSESKKTGSKIFINDMKAKHCLANVLSMRCIDMYNSVTPQMIAISIDIPIVEAEVSLDYLQNKGYIRKYGVNGIGSFYCMSPKGTKSLRSRDARSFLKLRSQGNSDEGELEDALHPVLTRIAYAKLLTKYFEEFENHLENQSEMIGNECFGIKIVNEDSTYLFTGSFWNTANEANEYVTDLKEKYFNDEYDRLLVAGFNVDMAKRNAEYLIEVLKLDEINNVYCYSLIDEIYLNYLDKSILEFSDIFMPEEKEAEWPELDELQENEEIELGEEITAADEVVETEKESHEEDIKELEQEIDIDEIMANVCHMITDGKTYCATTYLRSVMGDNGVIKEVYDRLAYAVNAPWMRCSYNSQKIFSLYSSGADIFSRYLMAAASLRNFFMNHASYDYNMKALYANVKSIPVVSNSCALTNVIYSLAVFKEDIHKGIDFYADYRVKDQVAVNKALDTLCSEAESYYHSYVFGQPKNHKGVKRFIDTWKIIFAIDGELSVYLQAVINKDLGMAELARDYLAENFISSGSSLEYSNLDLDKLNGFINDNWNKAHKNKGSKYKTTGLMSDLRNNLINAIEKVLKVVCEWLAFVDEEGTVKSDNGTKKYREIKKDLIKDMSEAKEDINRQLKSFNTEEAAGAVVLMDTLQELVSRMNGSYDERSHKYYYIDFLRGNDVLLEDTFLPDMRGKFGDFQELSLANRVLKHSKAKLMSFESRLEDIFNNYGDDYGSAELIIAYLEDMGNRSYSDKYNIRKSEELAESDAENRLYGFIENLELAQSYGQIEETKENKKEKIQKIANEWFEYARKSKNYGFFKLVLDQYSKKIHQDAKVRGTALLQELDKIKEQGGIDERKNARIREIQKMIEVQNYTVAEDLLAHINNDESEEEADAAGTDYLQKFIDEYDYNYRIVANSSRKLSDLVSSRIHNKDEKGARRLVDNWMSNGQPLGKSKLSVLLDALGFAGAEVKEQAKLGRVDNYLVTMKEAVGRKVNYKHPIAAFGSKAAEDGFRVVCLFGKYDADRLIEEFKNIAAARNTLVLLDYALPLSDRRRLARKIKSDLSDKVFAVLDRVLLMFLVNNYSVQFINQILMSAMMPFSYYQPYVWDSSKVMPPEIFMGRKDELEKIESPAGVNIVYGGRQLGKSALLKMAKMNIDNDENHDRAVFVEIKGLNYTRAAKKIGHELYDAGILEEDIDTTDWDDLARAIRRRLQSDSLQYIPYLLLLLDEADTFIESCEAVNFQPFDALKDIQSVGMDRFKFVIAGLHNIVRFKRDAALSNNSVLTHLTSITIKPFDKREARQLLEEPLYYLGLRFAEDKQSLVSLILANTNYFPGLIQLYCANLIEAMRKNDYAGYDQVDTPVYEVNPNHIKKVLSDSDFMDQIREKFEITLKLDEDNMYYIIALLMAYLYHQNTNSAAESEGFSAADIIHAAEEYSVKKVVGQREEVIEGLMQELLELNILRQTVNDLYLFSRYSFFQMMGNASEVEDKLCDYMED